MEKGADKYRGQFVVLRRVYTTLVTLCTPGIKTSAVTNQLFPNVFISRAICLDWKIKRTFSFSCFKDLNNFDNGKSIHKPDVILFLSEWKYGSLVSDGHWTGMQRSSRRRGDYWWMLFPPLIDSKSSGGCEARPRMISATNCGGWVCLRTCILS